MFEHYFWSPPRPTELAGRAVLVVENDYLIAAELCAVLLACGAQVIGPASDVEQARVLMDQQRLDCAVLDVNLHGSAVYPLANELQARGIATIFATGYEADLLPLNFRDSIYLQKPIDHEALIDAVRRVRSLA